MSKESSVQGEPERPATVASDISPELINEELNRIVASPAFAQSQRLIRFLRFVVEQSLEDKADHLKEYLIGLSVFDRTDGYDPRTDPIVRVEAGRLRTKLREYYSAEGKDDPVMIDLPKGSYIPTAKRRADKLIETGSPVPVRRKYNLVPLLLLVTTLVSSALAAYLYLQNRQIRKTAQAEKTAHIAPQLAPLWGPFLAPGTETHAVFGSPFFLTAPDYRMFLRPYDINEPTGLESNTAFLRLREKLGRLTGPRYDYALVGELLALVKLTSFFGASGVPLKALESQKTNWDSIQSGNIILLGAPRMNHLIRRFPHSIDFEWASENEVRNRKPQAGESAVYSARFHEGFYDLDPASWQNAFTYVIVCSFPGFVPDREILVLSAHGGPGSWGVVDYLTRPETAGPLLARINNSRPGKKNHFQLLLRVYVDRGVPIRTEYVTHHLTSFPASETRNGNLP
ncbi:MAG: hypothetical protein EHM61_25955 [Acidobacteria bacterium]|nr:MAG: hypothetical protein EHM61_25955 [Acidobacteriota bacterium]